MISGQEDGTIITAPGIVRLESVKYDRIRRRSAAKQSGNMTFVGFIDNVNPNGLALRQRLYDGCHRGLHGGKDTRPGFCVMRPR